MKLAVRGKKIRQEGDELRVWEECKWIIKLWLQATVIWPKMHPQRRTLFFLLIYHVEIVILINAQLVVATLMVNSLSSNLGALFLAAVKLYFMTWQPYEETHKNRWCCLPFDGTKELLNVRLLAWLCASERCAPQLGVPCTCLCVSAWKNKPNVSGGGEDFRSINTVMKVIQKKQQKKEKHGFFHRAGKC